MTVKDMIVIFSFQFNVFDMGGEHHASVHIDVAEELAGQLPVINRQAGDFAA